MEANEIVDKTVCGTKWTVVLSTLAIPVSYLTLIILGRISTEALGIYGLVGVYVSFITTFILIGGGASIIKYLPEIEDKKKLTFILSFIEIIFLISIISVVLCYLFPQYIYIIFDIDIKNNSLNYLILLMPIIIIYSIFDFALNGLMEIKISVMMRQLIVYGNLLIFGIFYIFFKDFFLKDTWIVIWGYTIAIYFILSIVALYMTLKKLNIIRSLSDAVSYVLKYSNQDAIKKYTLFEMYLPPNFWRFTIYMYFSTILIFAYDKIDQLLILRYFSINDFGIYYAALQTAMFIRFIPMLVGSILLPTFANLIASNEIELIRNGYITIAKYNTFLVVPPALFCIFFSTELMKIFGDIYVQNHLVLVVLGLCLMVSSMGGVNSSLIVANGKNGIYLLNSLVQVILEFILIILMVGKFGILAFAIGKGVSIIIAQIGLFLIIDRSLNMNIKVPYEYILSFPTAILALITYMIINPRDLISSVISFSVSIAFFLYMGRYSFKDINLLISCARGR